VLLEIDFVHKKLPIDSCHLCGD